MAQPLPAVSAPVRELAAKIYTDLVVRAVQVTESAVKMQAAPDNLAKLSFKLATVFDNCERELNEASLPKNQDFKVDAASIASWTTK
jgi:hypothetical protein